MMPEEKKDIKGMVLLKERDIVIGVVIYGIVMWAAGYVWAVLS